jgi:glycosyltransferase involved in cell wall biosynthesis
MALKISIIASDLSGAVAIRAFLIAQALGRLEYDVEIIGFTFRDELYASPPQGVRIQTLPGVALPGFISSARELLRKMDGDIIYALKPLPMSFGVALVGRLMQRRPLILDIDDWETSWLKEDWAWHVTLKQMAIATFRKNAGMRNPNHPKYIRWMERLVPRADAITVHTTFLKERFGGVYLPNGKDTALFDPAKFDPQVSRARHGLAGFRVLLFPGSPRPHKGLEDLLTALDALNEDDLRLVIVGGSTYDNYDDKLIQKWGRWIIKLPRSSVETMPEIVSCAHVLVVPSRNSPISNAQFPLKLTDGMSMAKPVLATRVGDMPDILSDTGYLVEPGNSVQMAAAIREIFRDYGNAEAKGRAARERCIARYSLNAMSTALSHLVESVQHA